MTRPMIRPMVRKDPSTLARGRQRGATMISVMLLTVSLMTLGLLVVRSSAREVTQAGQLVARERAMEAAQASLELAAAQYLRMDVYDTELAGYYPGPGPGGSCTVASQDCIPDDTNIVTGQRNAELSGLGVDCGGRPCMRQGAVSNLRDVNGATVPWNDIPALDILDSGDPEARVSVWIRNNSADALGPSGSGSWLADGDGRIVLTASATVRNTTVTIEQEVLLRLGVGPEALLPQTPDEGYGGGHNNDNSAVSVCTESYVSATPT